MRTHRLLARAAVAALLFTVPLSLHPQSDGPVARAYRTTADRLIDAALADSGAAWNTLISRYIGTIPPSGDMPAAEHVNLRLEAPARLRPSCTRRLRLRTCPITYQ